jgi:hypothetical protein
VSTEIVDSKGIQTDPHTTERVIESLVRRGDISALSHEERASYYLHLCESLGLSAASQPFIPLHLNGKEVLYASRTATDQLAAIHCLTREIIDGPKVIDLAGTKIVYAACRATHPNGRTETAVATVSVSDPLNCYMKVETKAKRRATLSILGLGVLDESELETIPDQVKGPSSGLATGTEPRDHDWSLDSSFEKFRAAVQCIEMPYEAVTVWLRYRGEIAGMPADIRKEAWRILCWRVEDVGKIESGEGHEWLKSHIAAEEARNAAVMPGQTDNDSESSQADPRYVPKTVIDAVAQYGIPLPLSAAAAIWHDHALDGTLWSAEERDATVAFLRYQARVSSEEMKRAIKAEQRLPVDPAHNIETEKPQAAVADGSDAQDQCEQIVEQWARDVQAARSVDELRDIYAEAQKSTASQPWGDDTGPRALKNLASLCAKRKADIALPGSSIADIERNALELAQGIAGKTPEEERFRAYVMSKANRFELEHGIENHLSEYDLSAETIVRIAAPRLAELAASTKYPLTSMQSINTIRALANGTYKATWREE